MEWSTACPDWADRLRRGESIIPPPIFPAQAEEALRVFKALRIVDAPNSPTFGEACAPWVFDLVASIFGAYEVESGRRLITEWFILIPKKNSKSTIAAGIMMTALILNWRASAEFAILAPTVEIANNSFYPARDMCLERVDEDLAALIHAQSHVKTLTNRNSGAACKVLAADSNTVGGKKGVGTLVDELWLFGRVADAENMLREATGGLASRPEGFTVYLTTQSDDPPAGVFKQKLQYARDVRDGKIVDPRFVPIIYEFPDEMIRAGEHRKPENFGIVNPNLGYSVDQEFLEREFQKADYDGEDSMRGFLAKHLNVEVGLALRSDRWSGADYWERNGDPLLTLDALLERSEVVTVGVDAGGSDDMSALFVMGRERDTGRWLGWCHCWVKRSALALRKSEAARWRGFADDGDLTITDDLAQQVTEIGEMVAKIDATGLLAEKGIGVDRARVDAILDEFNAVGIGDERMQAVPQNWTLMGPIIACDRKLTEDGLVHADQPIMAWAVGNARVEVQKNAFTITKQASGTSKIDPLMAMFDAAALMARNPTAGAEFQVFFAG